MNKPIVNHAKWYAGQPTIIYIWESMWREIANRLDDEYDDSVDEGFIWTDKQEQQRKQASIHWSILDAMLDEAEQLRDNVRVIHRPFQWKFNLVVRKENE